MLLLQLQVVCHQTVRVVPEFLRNTVTHLANASDLLVVFVSQRRLRFIIHNYPAAPRESPPPARWGRDTPSGYFIGPARARRIAPAPRLPAPLRGSPWPRLPEGPSIPTKAPGQTSRSLRRRKLEAVLMAQALGQQGLQGHQGHQGHEENRRDESFPRPCCPCCPCGPCLASAAQAPSS